MANSCRSCGRKYVHGESFCSNCGVAHPETVEPTVNKGRKLSGWTIGAFFLLIAVVVGTIVFINSDSERVEIKNEVEQAPVRGSILSVEEAKDLSIYTTTLHNGEKEAEVYLVPMENLEEEGDQEYTGTFAFYMASPGHKQTVKQEQLAVTKETLHIKEDLTQFHDYEIGEMNFLGFFEEEAPDSKSLTLWIFDGEEMKESLFNGDPNLHLSDENIRIIGDKFIQSFNYEDGGANVASWTFTTWEWQDSAQGFTKFYEVAHTEKEQYGRMNGEYHETAWRNMPHYYLPFPQFTFNDQAKELLVEGKLINEHVHLGMPIEDVLKMYPNHTGTDYYEGGPYYSYPEGVLYFYNELTNNVNFIVYAGAALTNTVEDFLSYYGEPQASGYDELEDADYHIFRIGDYRLRLNIKENGAISSVWFSEW